MGINIVPDQDPLHPGDAWWPANLWEYFHLTFKDKLKDMNSLTFDLLFGASQSVYLIHFKFPPKEGWRSG